LTIKELIDRYIDKTRDLKSTVKLFQPFIDLIYPPRCAICQEFLWKDRAEKNQKELLFCQPCFDGFFEITSPLCTVCGRPFASMVEEDHPCEDCLSKTPFYDMVRAPYLYEGGIMEAIHQFKYAGRTHLADTLGPLLAFFVKEWMGPTPECLTIPVPLHPKRLRERGFNQSLLLARHVASLLGTELDFLSLRRIRYTQPQTGLKSEERKRNVRKAFEITNQEVIKGRNVLLVDDVTTTGSTLNECARALKRAGAEKVFGLVLARTAGVY
jgi:ComF family protein